MSKKYEFVGPAKEIVIPPMYMDRLHFGDNGRYSYVRRIRALCSFGNIKKGTIGGWIESENNLSHEGLSWVEGNAIVCSDAFVNENATVRDSALVLDNARIYGNAVISDRAIIHGNAMIYGQANICGEAEVCGNARVLDNAKIGNSTYSIPFQIVSGNAQIYGDAIIINAEVICGNAKVQHGDLRGFFEHRLFSFPDSEFRCFTYTISNRKWNFCQISIQSKHKLEYRANHACFSMTTEEASRFIGKKNAATFKLHEKELQAIDDWMKVTPPLRDENKM